MKEIDVTSNNKITRQQISRALHNGTLVFDLICSFLLLFEDGNSKIYLGRPVSSLTSNAEMLLHVVTVC